MKKPSFETLNKVMAACVVAGVAFMVGIGVAAYAGVPVDYQDEINTCSMAREMAEPEINAPHDGMFFDARGVVDNIYYGSEGEGFVYYLIYDDIDAGMEYEAIRVDKATYFAVVDCLEHKGEMYGTMTATKDYESVVYILTVEEL